MFCVFVVRFEPFAGIFCGCVDKGVDFLLGLLLDFLRLS